MRLMENVVKQQLGIYVFGRLDHKMIGTWLPDELVAWMNDVWKMVA